MKTPQLEDGYARIANLLLEDLAQCSAIPSHVRCLLYIIRMTYGFGRKDATLRLGDFEKACRISYCNVNRSINKLRQSGLISVFKTEAKCVNTFRINKDKSAWQTSSKVKRIDRETFKNEDGIDPTHQNHTPIDGAINTSSKVKGKIFTPEKAPYKENHKEKDLEYIPTAKKSSNLKKPFKKTGEWRFKRKCGIPSQFYLTDKMRDYAMGKGIAVNRLDEIFERFVNYHESKGSMFIDWTAAWRTWCLNDLKYNKPEEDVFDAYLRRGGSKGKGNQGTGDLPE